MTNLVSTIIFGVMLVFIFSFSLQQTELERIPLYPALLWVIILFTSTLGMARSFSVERENDVLDAVILAVQDRTCIFFAKFLTNLTLLLIVELIITPLLYLFSDLRVVLNLPLFCGTLILGSLGLALVGTLLNSITAQIQGTRLLLPILLFPLSIPLLITVIELTGIALQIKTVSPELWLYFLGIFDLVFMVLPLFLFNYIVEG